MYRKEYASVSDFCDQIIEVYDGLGGDFDYPEVNVVVGREIALKIVKCLMAEHNLDIESAEIFSYSDLYKDEYLISVSCDGIWIEPAKYDGTYTYVEGVTFVHEDVNSKFIKDNKDVANMMIEFAITEKYLREHEYYIKALYDLDKNFDNFASRLRDIGIVF